VFLGGMFSHLSDQVFMCCVRKVTLGHDDEYNGELGKHEEEGHWAFPHLFNRGPLD